MKGFDFTAALVLEDEVVKLRSLQEDDVKHLLGFALDEPETWMFSMVPVVGAAGMEKYVQTALEGRAAKKEFPFIVYDKRSGQYAGSTRYYDMQPENNTLQLGYTWYGKKFRGTGLNQHCKFLLLQFAFETLQVERVEFRADSTNARSIAAMKSIGCVEEGVLRNNSPRASGGRRSSIVLSILKEEWENKVKSELQKKLV